MVTSLATSENELWKGLVIPPSMGISYAYAFHVVFRSQQADLQHFTRTLEQWLYTVPYIPYIYQHSNLALEVDNKV